MRWSKEGKREGCREEESERDGWSFQKLWYAHTTWPVGFGFRPNVVPRRKYIQQLGAGHVMDFP